MIVYKNSSDTERFLRELKNRLKQFSLELHPEKTRLIEFGRFAASTRAKAKLGALLFSSRIRHTRSTRDWSSDVCSSDLQRRGRGRAHRHARYDVPGDPCSAAGGG